MRSKSIIHVGLAAVATMLTVQAANAQTWYSAVAPANYSTGFWNNRSSDNASSTDVCNIGAVLMGNASNSNCNAEVPAGLLPLSSAQQLTGGPGVRGAYLAATGSSGNSTTGWLMNAGEYRFDLYGKMTGACQSLSCSNPRFGYFTFDSFGARVLTEIVTSIPGSVTFNTSSAWGFWIGATRPQPGPGLLAAYFSDKMTCNVSLTLTGCGTASASQQQFALFTGTVGSAPSLAGNVIQAPLLSRYWIGMEDVAGGSDYDYNDVVGSFTSLPEPASFALFGTGLLGVFAVGRRRRK